MSIAAKPGDTILRLKVTLKGSKPPIWRRFDIPESATLNDLHYTLQIVMGWQLCHLHDFTVGKQRYCDEMAMDGSVFDNSINEKSVTLSQIFEKEKDKIEYMYDFGDGWEHTVVLEKRVAAESGVKFPRCVTGKLACPPEDSGSLWGYYDKLDALQDETHEMHEEYVEWMGEDFDPTYFDVEEVNAELLHIDAWRARAEEPY